MLWVIVVSIFAFPPLLTALIAVAEEVRWHEFKKETGIK